MCVFQHRFGGRAERRFALGNTNYKTNNTSTTRHQPPPKTPNTLHNNHPPPLIVVIMSHAEEHLRLALVDVEADGADAPRAHAVEQRV